MLLDDDDDTPESSRPKHTDELCAVAGLLLPFVAVAVPVPLLLRFTGVDQPASVIPSLRSKVSSQSLCLSSITDRRSPPAIEHPRLLPR